VGTNFRGNKGFENFSGIYFCQPHSLYKIEDISYSSNNVIPFVISKYSIFVEF